MPAIYPSEPFDINSTSPGSANILTGNKLVIMYTGIDSRNRQTMPRTLWLDESGKQEVQYPIMEVETLGGLSTHMSNVLLAVGALTKVQRITSTQIDHSIVESFGARGKTCMHYICIQINPTLAVGADAHMYLSNNETAPITVTKLDAWSMGTPKMN
ncbi:hypothetical protein IFM89_033956 [Coptis chinensis]|uniref:Uncharacterized protein n=1 Tax=Coptis chinensis TaxID=261450 RepID=A0A835HP63_9MAGN|nr:hypothetical protein IFM89_033956 [Coptis chinensis]